MKAFGEMGKKEDLLSKRVPSPGVPSEKGDNL